jgi:hypothetical protein
MDKCLKTVESLGDPVASNTDKAVGILSDLGKDPKFWVGVGTNVASTTIGAAGNIAMVFDIVDLLLGQKWTKYPETSMFQNVFGSTDAEFMKAGDGMFFFKDLPLGIQFEKAEAAARSQNTSISNIGDVKVTWGANNRAIPQSPAPNAAEEKFAKYLNMAAEAYEKPIKDCMREWARKLFASMDPPIEQTDDELDSFVKDLQTQIYNEVSNVYKFSATIPEDKDPASKANSAYCKPISFKDPNFMLTPSAKCDPLYRDAFEQYLKKNYKNMELRQMVDQDCELSPEADAVVANICAAPTRSVTYKMSNTKTGAKKDVVVKIDEASFPVYNNDVLGDGKSCDKVAAALANRPMVNSIMTTDLTGQKKQNVIFACEPLPTVPQAELQDWEIEVEEKKLENFSLLREGYKMRYAITDVATEAAEKAAREAAEKAAKEAAEKAAKEAAERAIREASEKAIREASEKAIREASEKAIKEGLTTAQKSLVKNMTDGMAARISRGASAFKESAQKLASQAADVLKRYPKLTLAGLTVAGLAIYAAATGKSLTQAAGELAGTITSGLANVLNDTACAAGICPSKMWDTAKKVLIVVAILIAIYLFFKFRNTIRGKSARVSRW